MGEKSVIVAKHLRKNTLGYMGVSERISVVVDGVTHIVEEVLSLEGKTVFVIADLTGETVPCQRG